MHRHSTVATPTNSLQVLLASISCMLASNIQKGQRKHFVPTASRSHRPECHVGARITNLPSAHQDHLTKLCHAPLASTPNHAKQPSSTPPYFLLGLLALLLTPFLAPPLPDSGSLSGPFLVLHSFVSTLSDPVPCKLVSAHSTPLDPALGSSASDRRLLYALPSHPRSPSTSSRRRLPFPSVLCLPLQSIPLRLVCACACRVVRRSGDGHRLQLRHQARRGRSHGAYLLELVGGGRVVGVDDAARHCRRRRRRHHHPRRRRRRLGCETRHGLGRAQSCS